MSKIIAAIGCSVSAVVCFMAAWKLCESDRMSWIFFAIFGMTSLILTMGIAFQPETKKDFDI